MAWDNAPSAKMSWASDAATRTVGPGFPVALLSASNASEMLCLKNLDLEYDPASSTR